MPANLVDAQFSGPFVIACALLTGKVDWNSLQQIHEPGLRALMTRITCVHDPEIEVEFPTNMAGKITIVADGQRHIRSSIIPSGDPGNFPDADLVKAKFLQLVQHGLGSEIGEVLCTRICTIDTSSRAETLFD